MRKNPVHRLPFLIIYEDRDIIVIDKPAGMLTVHTRVQGRLARENQFTVENVLTDYLRKGQWKSSKRAWLVHRLDRGTSGVMMFAKDRDFAEILRDNWGELTGKFYVARVAGVIEENEGCFESYLRDDEKTFKVRSVSNPKFGKYAKTVWRKLSVSKDSTLVEIELKSGRKNQIRVHFSENGHPVIGDVKYGGPKNERILLHSKMLRFTHPKSGKKFEWTAEVPFK